MNNYIQVTFHEWVPYSSLSVGVGDEPTDVAAITLHLINVHPKSFTARVTWAVDLRRVVDVINVLSKQTLHPYSITRVIVS